MDMQTYLNDLAAEKILLLEIDDTHYLSDTAYATEPGDTPANTIYEPVIAKGGIPRFTRRIQELWGGKSLSSWGTVKLVDSVVNGVDLAAIDIRGLPVKGFITGPRHTILHENRLQTMQGVIGPKRIDADGLLSFDVMDDQTKFAAIELPLNKYDSATMGGSFPTANHGLSKPLALGRCVNVSPRLIDASTRTYQVNDGTEYGAIQNIYNPKDNGVSISITNIDLNAGTFRLSANPIGQVTVDVDGVKDGTEWLNTTTEIVDWLARTFGGMSAGNISINNLPTGTVGLYLDSPVALDEVITRFMRGCMGYWYFSPIGDLIAQQVALPVVGGQSFDETMHLSKLECTESDNLFWSIPITYRPNYTQVEPAGTVSASDAAWLRSATMSTVFEDSAIQTAYSYATASPELNTLFYYQADAETVGGLALSLFNAPHYRAKVDLPITAPLIELGDSVNLQDAGARDGDYLVIGITDEWDGEIPIIQVEVWG